MRVKNLEFRRLEEREPEIIAWVESNVNTIAGDYCYTLLWYHKNKEGYYIQFIGDRPLVFEDQELLWKMMKYGQTVLDAELELLK
jgi:hypothetical protein